MSHFIVIELFKKFMSEGTGTDLCKNQVRKQTGLPDCKVRAIIAESAECQELITQRMQQRINKSRRSAGVPRWNQEKTQG